MGTGGWRKAEESFFAHKIVLIITVSMGNTDGVDLDDTIGDLPDWVWTWASSFDEPV